MTAWTKEMRDRGYETDYQRAKALRMSHSVISRLRSGENGPGPRFIARTCNLGIPYEKVFRQRKGRKTRQKKGAA